MHYLALGGTEEIADILDLVNVWQEPFFQRFRDKMGRRKLSGACRNVFSMQMMGNAELGRELGGLSKGGWS